MPVMSFFASKLKLHKVHATLSYPLKQQVAEMAVIHLLTNNNTVGMLDIYWFFPSFTLENSGICVLPVQ